MLGYAEIQHISRKVALEARANKRLPYVPWSQDFENGGKGINIPNFGDYRPKGWRKLEKTFFCDSSGFGSDLEPALTIKQFLAELQAYSTLYPDRGYAIIEEGQFQLYVGVFAPVKRKGI